MNHPKPSLKTLGSYCEVQLGNKVNSFCQNANRIVFDVYQENSLKNDTLESMGSGEGKRTLTRHDTHDNKTQLFKMIADVVTCKCEEGIVICTKDDKVLMNRQIIKSNLEPCNHEEADTRLFVHARDAALT